MSLWQVDDSIYGMYFWDPSGRYGPYVGDYESYLNLPEQPGAGAGGGISISIPSRTVNLAGFKITIGGGTWTGSVGSGAGRQVATTLSNQFEQGMKQNLAVYQAGQISRSDGVSNFDTLWNEYLSALNSAGSAEKVRAVADRQRGGQFDWFAAYRDPISGTPGVGGPPPGGGITPGVPPMGGGGFIDWVSKNLLWVGLVVVAVLILRR